MAQVDDHVAVEGHNNPCVHPDDVQVSTVQPRQQQRATPSSAPASGEADEDVQEEFELKYGAAHVIRLFVPVSICMLVVIVTIQTVQYYSRDDGVYLMYTPFHPKSSDGAGTIFLQSMGNALIILALVVVMTVALILLYKYEFYKIIHGWLIISSLLLLSLFTMLYAIEVLITWNICVDIITAAIVLWNYAVMGMFCIHWKGPLRLQQLYLICVAALMSLVFIKFLPEWTTWTVLAVISVWDLVAVLCPFGPLRILVETAQQRNEPLMPGLIYSSGIMYTLVGLSDVNLTKAEHEPPESTPPVNRTQRESGDGDDSSPQSTSTAGTSVQVVTDQEAQTAGFDQRWHANRNTTAVRRIAVPPTEGATNSDAQAAARVLNGDKQHRPTPPQSNRSVAPGEAAARSIGTNGAGNEMEDEDEEERGVKLGLGDFIFYSVLVGKASSYFDWNTTIACYVAILIGLCFTLVLLAVFKKALPALPISIAFGLVFYFCTSYIISPFTNAIALRQIIL